MEVHVLYLDPKMLFVSSTKREKFDLFRKDITALSKLCVYHMCFRLWAQSFLQGVPVVYVILGWMKHRFERSTANIKKTGGENKYSCLIIY